VDKKIKQVIFNDSNIADTIYHIACPYCYDSGYYYNIVDGNILYCQECGNRFFVIKED